MNPTTQASAPLKPTVGRMVYYKARGSADGVFPKVDRAAVVTDVRLIDYSKNDAGFGDDNHVKGADNKEGFQVRLCVMNPEGLFFSGWLNQGQEGGEWDWMPFQKDQQMRAGYAVNPIPPQTDSPDQGKII